MQARNTVPFRHEAEAMPPESLTSCAARTARILPFYVGLHFHGYTDGFSRLERHLETRSSLENPLMCFWMAWIKESGEEELL